MDMPVGTAPGNLLHAEKFAKFMGWAAEIRRTAILGRVMQQVFLELWPFMRLSGSIRQNIRYLSRKEPLNAVLVFKDINWNDAHTI
jgi:hypothetical protein